MDEEKARYGVPEVSEGEGEGEGASDRGSHGEDKAQGCRQPGRHSAQNAERGLVAVREPQTAQHRGQQM
ncbi:hypothetical protein AB0I54_28640 [Streptomyces sp. NPDC050625]|uniref:hypothetical protein n=1 Tax=Streptomyces sp. NPDC050625 TaxID=3154629 RepID=UPI00343F8099